MYFFPLCEITDKALVLLQLACRGSEDVVSGRFVRPQRLLNPVDKVLRCSLHDGRLVGGP
jgi:hypothetical protein